jgi:hypothetical protein
MNIQRHTRELDCIVLLALQDIQESIDKSGLRLGLEISTTCEPDVRCPASRSSTYIFQIKLRLPANIRIRV